MHTTQQKAKSCENKRCGRVAYRKKVSKFFIFKARVTKHLMYNYKINERTFQKKKGLYNQS